MTSRIGGIAFILLVVSAAPLAGQVLRSLSLSADRGLAVQGYALRSGEERRLATSLPLFSFVVNNSLRSSTDATAQQEGDSVRLTFHDGLLAGVTPVAAFHRGWKCIVMIRNTSRDTIRVENLVPLGQAPDRVYITATGPVTYENRLSRSALFRPGVGPIGVVLPDDAWEMGFCDVPAGDGESLAAIARRTGSTGTDEHRFFTRLYPGGSVDYELYAEVHAGDWHEGLKLMFQKRWLYDLDSFDNTLFDRKDLQWIRHSYLMVLQFAWDHDYFDAHHGGYHFNPFLTARDSILGRYDVYVLWPTWPRLGLDQRNQWDMYGDLPGGLAELRRQVNFTHAHGGRYFISYNPWDESTRKENHLEGMSRLLRELDADGVVLDTWGESSKEFQQVVDRVKPGIILYSEGMAVPKDMPGIVAGRVHDALFMPPPLNLNKFIKPDFAIFRVLQVMEGRLHREVAVAFFNGYGTEINPMRPGRPDWIDDELRYLGRTTMILRGSSSAFLSRDWLPLLPTLTDSVWVNKWPTPSKTLYTVYSLKPEGWNGPLFEAPVPQDSHYVSLWHHREIKPDTVGGRHWIPVEVEGFSRAALGTRREGNVDCVAMLPNLLKVRLDRDSLRVQSTGGDSVLLWAGDPTYAAKAARLPVGHAVVSLMRYFGRHEGKFVVQLFDRGELADERVVRLPLATPRLISSLMRTLPAASPPKGMVPVPAGDFIFKTTRSFLSPNEAIPYPDYSTGERVHVRKFYIDRYPVTNEQFLRFLSATKYVPKDAANFLKHWIHGRPPRGLENHPVVYVSLEDARAYARWAGKRLPTEIEWQYAAQGTDGRKWPWGDEFDSTKCNASLGNTTPVDAFPEGASPFGVVDLVGNVWQLTNDVYDDGSYYFGIIRGGSYYNPSSSWWYVRGGPQPVDNPQILLMVSPSLDRNATVGFRCIVDRE